MQYDPYRMVESCMIILWKRENESINEPSWPLFMSLNQPRMKCNVFTSALKSDSAGRMCTDGKLMFYWSQCTFTSAVDLQAFCRNVEDSFSPPPQVEQIISLTVVVWFNSNGNRQSIPGVIKKFQLYAQKTKLYLLYIWLTSPSKVWLTLLCEPTLYLQLTWGFAA